MPWLVPTVGTSQVCGLRGGCYPVSIAFQTASLAAGTYTGIITFSDPNAVDSPQYHQRHRASGRRRPEQSWLSIWPPVPPRPPLSPPMGQSRPTVSNAPWLTTSTACERGQWSYVTTVTATAGSSMAATDYNGTIRSAGSSFAPDNKTDRRDVECHHAADCASQQQLAFVQRPARSQSADRRRGRDGCRKRHADYLERYRTAASNGTWLTAATRERRHHRHSRSHRAFARRITPARLPSRATASTEIWSSRWNLRL